MLDPATPQTNRWGNDSSSDYSTGHALASSPLFRDEDSDTPPRARQSSSRSSLSPNARKSRDLEHLTSSLPSRSAQSDSLENGTALDFPDSDSGSLSTPQKSNGAESDTDELGSYSALSKKADSILAAAKKRLNLLEGNIKGARHSLSYDPIEGSTPSEYGHLKTSSTDDGNRLSRSPSMRINFGQPRSSTTPSRTTKSHTRNFSETSVPSPRGSVTIGSMHPQFQIPRDLGQVPTLARQTSFKGSRRESTLEPVVEEAGSPTKTTFEESPTNTQTSRTTQYRTETEIVRERLSSIQEGVLQAVDSRRSWQHPVPRVLPEEVAAIKEVKALERTLNRQEAVIGQMERTERYDFPKRHSRDTEWEGMTNQHFYESGGAYMDDEYRSEGDDTDYRSVLEELEDVEPNLDAAHEDRADAFDYENFIIHSVFNNASLRPTRSPSIGSLTSTSTPRAYSDVDGDVEDENGDDNEETESEQQTQSERREKSHKSNRSVDSFETAHTFMNSSGDSSEVEDYEDLLHDSTHTSFPLPPSMLASQQPSSLFEGSEPTTPTTEVSKGLNGSLRAQGGRRPASMIFSAIVDPLTSSRGPNLDEADQTLVRSLAEAMRFACVQLQRNNLDAEIAADWRSKLEEARRVLSGQDEMM